MKINRYVAPALAIIATVIALFGTWFTATTSVTGHTRTSTLLEVLRGESFVEYTSQRWLWISGVGVILVVLSGLLNENFRKKVAEAGSYLFVILPAWSLFHVFVGDEDINAGWALYATAGLAVAIVIVARLIPETIDDFEQANAHRDTDQISIG